MTEVLRLGLNATVKEVLAFKSHQGDGGTAVYSVASSGILRVEPITTRGARTISLWRALAERAPCPVAANAFLVAALAFGFLLAALTAVLGLLVAHFLAMRAIREHNEKEDFLLFFESSQDELDRKVVDRRCIAGSAAQHLPPCRSRCLGGAELRRAQAEASPGRSGRARPRTRACSRGAMACCSLQCSHPQVLPHPFRLPEMLADAVNNMARNSLFFFLFDHCASLFEDSSRISLEAFVAKCVCRN